ncbi:DNA polymerase eta [Thrips palmi]|uniref:DNA polymerase eta n=1 Tax=Thrips palmi TaxID=161013 RepID=A0A6P9A1B0_THRPL|nr:DNA polymerase eta [Thrips palmi]
MSLSTMSDNRVIVLVDMDCFYCQVEVRLNPAHTGKPLAVVQYNAWRGGGIIAVNYEARDKGVKRGMRGDEAKKLCPDIVLCKVAEVRGKADLTKYRDAGREIVDVLQGFSNCVQVASIDESYMDITEAVEDRLLQVLEQDNALCIEKLPSTFVIGFSDDKSNDEDQRVAGVKNWLENLADPTCMRLAVGAMITEEMRAAVYKQTSFRCSAGISYNKPLAKLVCAVHKPNRQTVLPPDKVELFFSTLPLRKMRNLGGKFGTEVVEKLGCQTMGDLAKYSLQELQRCYDEKNGLWLYNIAHGIDHEPVTKRLIAKSIGCSKNFPGRTALAARQKVEHWMRELTTELVVRLTEDQVTNKRRAQHLTVSVSQDSSDGSLATSARSGALPCYNVDRIVALALQLISKTNIGSNPTLSWDPPIKNISLSAGKFTTDCSSQKSSIQSFFKQVTKEEASNSSDTITEHLYKNNSAKISLSAHNEEQNVHKQEPNMKHRSSLDNYFKQNNVCSDNDSSRDMFLDDESPGNISNEFTDQVSEKTEAFPHVDKNSSLDGKVTHSSKRKQQSISSEGVSCPANLESAATHSFFARYILSYKKRKTTEVPIESEPVPSTSKGLAHNIPQHSPSNCDTDSSDSQNANENDDDILEKCVECGKLIPLQEFPEHVDYHSALNLQKELNETLTPPENNVSRVSVVESAHAHSSHGSSSRGEESLPPEADPSSDPPVEKCSYCGKLIPLQEFPEHVDYHSALDLEKELNRAPPPPPAANSNASLVPAKKKKGRTNKQAPSPAKKVQSNSITAFFVPK